MVYVLHAKPIGGRYPSVDWGEGNFPSAEMIEPPADGLPPIGAFKSGVPVDGSELPKCITWDGRGQKLPADFENVPQINLSASAKAVVEATEPGIHQFFPFDCVSPNGAKIETRYWLYICNRRDSISRGRSNSVLDEFGEYVPPGHAVRYKLEIPSHVDVAAPNRFVFDQAKIGDAHLWREARADGLPLMSQTLFEAINSAGFTGFAPSDKKEVI